MEKRIITTDVTEEDFSLEGNLRPQTLDDYIGQEKTKSTLKVYIEAAKQRDRKSTRLNSSHIEESRMPSSA